VSLAWLVALSPVQIRWAALNGNSLDLSLLRKKREDVKMRHGQISMQVCLTQCTQIPASQLEEALCDSSQTCLHGFLDGD
jgi:hypothetical protein